jgi:hypothetical protein
MPRKLNHMMKWQDDTGEELHIGDVVRFASNNENFYYPAEFPKLMGKIVPLSFGDGDTNIICIQCEGNSSTRNLRKCWSTRKVSDEEATLFMFGF